MKFTKVQKIPEPQEIIESMPVTESIKKIKEQRDKEIEAIFTGKDDRFILIIGPCSADNQDAVVDYITRLATIQEKVKDKILMIPRIYTNKPRTTGQGYKGMLHQPNPEKGTDMAQGIVAIRKLHLRAITETGLTSADEMLYPENHVYLDDLLSYVAVGARSVEDQQHRLVASGINIPIGMKNPTSGDISIMLNSIQAAQAEYKFIYRGWEVHTEGNPLAHAILRGAVDKFGNSIANYHYEDISTLIHAYESRNLKNLSIIIDTNHSNSNKDFSQQPRIAHEVIRNCHYDSLFKKAIKGLMVESYIEDGRQEIGANTYGRSITDPCLGWAKTEKMIFDIAEAL
ncbi:3-deoxy-7-phosphoheptulonate synthase [Clostridia bacterium]|nr:3-deoxy-7-phosphoheptulonate synthase [Clostridia bacterium]